VNYSTLSHESETCNRSPAISSTAFDTRPPDLPPASLMDTDFAITCPLVRRRRPQIQFLSIGPYLCSTLPSDPPHGDALALRYPSPPSGWDGTLTASCRTCAAYSRKGVCQWQTALRHANFRSYDNPHTICQNLPETAVTSAGAEEGQREELEACIPAAREGLGMQCVA